MHYRNDAFSKNGFDTLVARDESNLKFGQRIKFSVGDVEGINNAYTCSKEISAPNYTGLYKDYSGKADASMRAKRVTKVKKFLQSFYDFKRRYPHRNV